MRRLFGWLVTSLVFVVVGSYAWNHRHHVAVAIASPGLASDKDQMYEEARQAQQMVTVTGPMADYVTRQQAPAQVVTLEPIVPTASSPHRPREADRVGDSPVGTSTPILHKTFGVVGIVDLPFEIPAHAATPQLRGTCRSFLEQGGLQAGAQRAMPQQMWSSYC